MKAKSTLILLCSAVAAASCGFLDEPLRGDYSSETFYTNAENAIFAVNAVYSSLYNNTEWIFGDVASDDSVKGGNAGDNADINSINDFTATTDNGPLSTYWQHRYETISRANNVIANVPGIDMNDDLKSRIVGEAKFLRAYSYFCLVNVFGEIPVKTKPQVTYDAIHVGLSPVEDVYKQIENDLKDAIETLEITPLESGRASKGAALGLYAKVLLFQGKYNEAGNAIKDLEEQNVYDLESNYEDLFKQGGENSIESIFALHYGNTTDASLGNNLNQWFAPSKDGGYYFNAPTQSIVDCYEPGDVRLDVNIGRDGQPWFDGATYSSSWSEATGYLVKKYNEDVVEGMARNQCTLPQHILRYADVLLMKAEVLNEQNHPDLAVVELDKVRDRAGLSASPATSQAEVREAIRTERRRELAFEFHRFGDLMRYGKTYAQQCLGSEITWEGDRYYFPIPQAEFDANAALRK